MRTRAAVAVEAGKPLVVMDVELDGPKAGEVLVEIKATGMCHTDEFTHLGDDPKGFSLRFWPMRARASLLGSVKA